MIIGSPIVTAEGMREADRRTIERFGLPGLVLMERAALEVVRACRDVAPTAAHALVLCGGGNNGGDGFAIARLLLTHGLRVDVVETQRGHELKGDAARQRTLCLRMGMQPWRWDALDTSSPPFASDYDIVVDALIGTGLQDLPRGSTVDLIAYLRERYPRGSRRARVVAVDIPSGVFSNTGAAPLPVLEADVTVTFGAWKWGHLLGAGRAACGQVHVADIGIHRPYMEQLADATRVGCADLRSLYRPIDAGAHKGTQGRILLAVGSTQTPGAAVLAAGGALHTGAGLVDVSAPRETLRLVWQRHPECLGAATQGLAERLRLADACVVGSGCGGPKRAGRLLARVHDAGASLPTVLDADALRAIAAGAPRPLGPLVMTPHPGELAALLDADTEAVVADLPRATREAAQRWGAWVVAKSSATLVAGPRAQDGLWCIEGGSPGLATGGSGDVLAGTIGALLARYTPLHAALLGCWAHAEASRECALRRGAEGLLPASLATAIGRVWGQLQS